MAPQGAPGFGVGIWLGHEPAGIAASTGPGKDAGPVSSIFHVILHETRNRLIEINATGPMRR